MSKIISNIKERVLLLAEKQEVSKSIFFNKVDLKYSNFTGKSKESDLTSKAVGQILLYYPEVNPKWLLTGEGEMLNNQEDSNQEVNEEQKGIPLIPVEAMAGWGVGDITVMDYETGRYNVPEFNELNIDFMIRVKGSSMYPKYNSGDIVACRKLPLDTFFQWNKVYVLDTIQGAMVKRICKSEDDNRISCVSDNKSYDPFELNKNQIYSLAIVLGVIRLE